MEICFCTATGTSPTTSMNCNREASTVFNTVWTIGTGMSMAMPLACSRGASQRSLPKSETLAHPHYARRFVASLVRVSPPRHTPEPIRHWPADNVFHLRPERQISAFAAGLDTDLRHRAHPISLASTSSVRKLRPRVHLISLASTPGVLDLRPRAHLLPKCPAKSAYNWNFAMCVSCDGSVTHSRPVKLLPRVKETTRHRPCR